MNTVEISYIHTLHTKVYVAYPVCFEPIESLSNFYSFSSNLRYTENENEYFYSVSYPCVSLRSNEPYSHFACWPRTCIKLATQ